MVGREYRTILLIFMTRRATISNSRLDPRFGRIAGRLLIEDCRVVERDRAQGFALDISHVGHEHERHLAAHALRNLAQVFLVVGRQYDPPDADAMRRQRPFLSARQSAARARAG